MTAPGDRRLRPVRPLTVLAEPDSVMLVAGEDLRYSLDAPGIGAWLPGLLGRLDGRAPVAEALAGVPPGSAAAALDLLLRLEAERVLVEPAAPELHRPRAPGAVVEGTGPLAEALRAGAPAGPGGELRVLAQDRLDWDELERFGRACRRAGVAALWASTAAGTRGLVSPLVLPDAGPCLACLVAGFERRSPLPELYERLRRHARAGGAIEPVAFPGPGIAILAGLVAAKLEAAALPQPDAALYRLHVLDPATLEVRAHPVPPDPACPECAPP